MAMAIATHPMNSLRDLLIAQLNDLYASEMHSESVIAKVQNAAASPKLSEALRSHLAETKVHIARLDRVFGEIGSKPKKAESHGSKGILDDCASIASKSKVEPHVRDAAIIATMQRLEHDEIASYGCARTWANLLGHQSAAAEMMKTLTEERRFDEALSRLAETLNQGALEPMTAGSR
jgi:ferritin-like metal-binding protein YciE